MSNDVSHDTGSSVSARHTIHVSCACVSDPSSTFHLALFTVSPIFYFILLIFHFTFHVGRFGVKTPRSLPRMRSLALWSKTPLSHVRKHIGETSVKANAHVPAAIMIEAPFVLHRGVQQTLGEECAWSGRPDFSRGCVVKSGSKLCRRDSDSSVFAWCILKREVKLSRCALFPRECVLNRDLKPQRQLQRCFIAEANHVQIQPSTLIKDVTVFQMASADHGCPLDCRFETM